MKSDLPITLVTSSLGAGGAERVLTLLASGWASSGRPVDIVTLQDEASFYPLPDSVHVHRLTVTGNSDSLVGAVGNNLARMFRLRRTIRDLKSGIIVSFGTETNILILLATIGLGVRVIVSERCDPKFYPSKSIWKFLRRVSYPLAAQLVVQTVAASKYFRFLSQGCLRVIPNPVQSPILTGRTIEISSPFVLAAGRLTRQKGFDRLLDAFAMVANKFPNWTLVIVGEGELRGVLQARAKELGIENRIKMPGIVSNLGDYMNAAEMFVLSSRYEGFPNVLTEAMASGLAVVATDCPSGPSDIVRDGENGLLVRPNNEAAIASAMSCLMESPRLRSAMGENGKKVAEIFSFIRILDDWEEMLSAIGRRP